MANAFASSPNSSFVTNPFDSVGSAWLRIRVASEERIHGKWHSAAILPVEVILGPKLSLSRERLIAIILAPIEQPWTPIDFILVPIKHSVITIDGVLIRANLPLAPASGSENGFAALPRHFGIL